MSISILYDPVMCNAVIVVNDRPLGIVFTSLTEGSVHTTAREAASWFLFGLRVSTDPHVDLSGVSPGAFSKMRLAAYHLMQEASRMATRIGLHEPKDVGMVFEAAFRGQLVQYGEAVVSIARERDLTPSVAAIEFNRALPEWGWIMPAAAAEVITASGTSQRL